MVKLGNWIWEGVSTETKPLNGFDIQTRDTKKGDPMGNVVVAWLISRDYNP